ncbi:ER membrane protein complex subunit 7 [Sitophilus oryzae]|uniref:ER membrane protein complex subunit 7 n=1 Tax=Sitophilus oryzae TaxID=7048 RepID=A0A6J2XS30_SITOR|nr:ER membrane protein complex subunit 7 [Sitophilus oryzae]
MNLIFLFLFILSVVSGETSLEEDVGSSRYVIEGRVFPLSDYQSTNGNWQSVTRIHVNGGEFIGFVKSDGSFAVHNLPSGSYVVEVLHPEYTFEPVRVEINSKGKFRARKVNHIQISQVVQVPYPLKIKALGKTRYFQVREQWRITDFLFNPMIMMMVCPLLLIMVLPKLMNDPETKKDFEQIQKMTKFEMPEMSDVVTNFFSSNGNQAGIKDSNGKDKETSKKGQKPRKRAPVKE